MFQSSSAFDYCTAVWCGWCQIIDVCKHDVVFSKVDNPRPCKALAMAIDCEAICEEQAKEQEPGHVPDIYG